MKHNITFTEGMILGEDTEFILKFLTYANSIYQIKKSLFKYIQRDSSAMHMLDKTLETDFLPVTRMLFNIRSMWRKEGLNQRVVDTLNGMYLPISVSTRLLHYSKAYKLNYNAFKKLYKDNNLSEKLALCRKEHFLGRQKHRYYQTYIMSKSILISYILAFLYSKVGGFLSKNH